MKRIYGSSDGSRSPSDLEIHSNMGSSRHLWIIDRLTKISNKYIITVIKKAEW